MSVYGGTVWGGTASLAGSPSPPADPSPPSGSSPFVIDAIQIPGGPSIQRDAGPLENGMFVDGVWVPDTADTPIYVDGFGISADGVAYFDTNQAGVNESQVLIISAGVVRVWLES